MPAARRRLLTRRPALGKLRVRGEARAGDAPLGCRRCRRSSGAGGAQFGGCTMDRDRDLLRLLASVERREVNRRELLKRGAAIGLGASALTAALSGVRGPRRAQAAGLL